MDLVTAFIILATAILGIAGLFWLISWLTRPSKSYSEAAVILEETGIDSDKKPPKHIAVATPEYVKPVVDDLKIIEGISPEIEEILNGNGIYSFTQLAATKVIILEVILMEGNLRTAKPATWPDQAALAAEGKWDELQKLQDELKGGRIA
jgi:predicted flap endonuclease-1-like 5' DNA nuclease